MMASTADSVRFKQMLPAADTVAQHQRTFTPGLKSRYKDEAFVYERKAEAQSLWERFLAWLGRWWDRLFGHSGKIDHGLSWTDIALRVIAVLLVGFMVYMIVRAILNKEGMWIFGRSSKKIEGYEISEDDIAAMDFPKLINTTQQSGNYRMAVRYYYLWLLRSLAEREIIAWHNDKTNTDYLYEIKNEGLRHEFEFLSYIYDYSWYGEFELDAEAYAKAEKAFLKTINTLKG